LVFVVILFYYFFFSSRRRHTRSKRDWSSECALPILSSVCKHLGCTVSWASDANNPDRFFCPCHNGLYEKSGENVPGTPPRGPLDMYEVGESDGFLTIGAIKENELV